MCGWRARARGRWGTAIAVRAATILIAPAAANAAGPLYGVVPQDGALPSRDDLNVMREGGVDGIRLMAHWGTVEPSPGERDWRTLEALVRETTERGIQHLLFLDGPPEWAARGEGRKCSGNACSVFAPKSKQARKAYAKFARAAENVSGMLAHLEEVRRVATAHGDSKVGLWITEIGWASGGPKREPYNKGNRGQARQLEKAHRKLAAKRRAFRLRGVFWYSWRDRPGGQRICAWCGRAGLRKVDGSAKPAWNAFVRMAAG
jgi:hypothetical protein